MQFISPQNSWRLLDTAYIRQFWDSLFWRIHRPSCFINNRNSLLRVTAQIEVANSFWISMNSQSKNVIWCWVLLRSSQDQNAGRIYSLRTDNSTFERVEVFKYLGTTLTNHNSMAEEIKSRLRSGNACYHSVQNLLSSRLLSKNVKIKIYKEL